MGPFSDVRNRRDRRRREKRDLMERQLLKENHDEIHEIQHLRSRRNLYKSRDLHERRELERALFRNRRSILYFDDHDIHHMKYHDNQCNHHRLDHCAWPQCNLSCPKIHNPFTGEEMDFIDLLLQFGLDLSSIANALGMDLPTLQTMDHDVLLQLLTQQR